MKSLSRRVVQLFAGLVLYGVSMAFMVESGLGLDPWDVFHQGLSKVTGISFGWVVILVGIPVLLLWIPLRQRPGFGTLANLVVIGLVVDRALTVLPPGGPLPARIAYLLAGIGLNGVATGLYIGSRFGPGPRDGLMTGIPRRLPRLSIRLVRTTIEVSVLVAGFLLGGTVGVGTIAYALAIGPICQLTIPLFTVPGAAEPAGAPAEPAGTPAKPVGGAAVEAVPGAAPDPAGLPVGDHHDTIASGNGDSAASLPHGG